MDEDDTGSIEWNLNQWKTRFLGEKLTDAIQDYERGYYERSFRKYKAIRQLIVSRIQPVELITCKKYEAFIPTLIVPTPGMNTYSPSINYTHILQNYGEYISKLLKELKLDWSEKGEESMF